MIDDLANDIRMCLGSQFEQDLFDAALYNLKDHNNKLRFGNFAYSMRELVRHFLDRLAPDSWVLDAPWFVVENKNNPQRAT